MRPSIDEEIAAWDKDFPAEMRTSRNEEAKSGEK
jgi:hypothetical protein